MDARRFAPATQRNREAILEVLTRVVPSGARVLEIASGTGEHAVFFGARLPVASWQPSDPSEGAWASIDAWRAHENATKVAPAIALDVHARPWPIERVDVVIAINMIHIAPWSACEALFAGAAELLGDRGLVVLYGPYKRGGAHTAPSNEAFDARLRGEDPAWGVRDLEAVVEVAAHAGFELREVAAMPANNFTVVFARLTGN